MLSRRALSVLAAVSTLSACAILPQDPHYQGPPPRPAELDQYYSRGDSYTNFTREPLIDKILFKADRIRIESPAGLITVDYYHTDQKNDDLVLVFPLLGGKNVIVDYFAEYFVQHGFDAAIVHRNNDFKDPAMFAQIEKLLRDGVVRDRIAMDFFEKEYGKKDFGSFGISRGAINVAITAGVDPRLKYNVMALGGTDLVDIFKKSNQPRIKFYRNTVMEQQHITKEQFYEFLKTNLRTDPEKVAQYMDGRNSLLLLSVFDRTVPFRYGMKLRKQLGEPRTVLMLADHYTSILYTQYVALAPPFRSIGVFPFDYIETEALGFYRESFNTGARTFKLAPIRILQLPFDLMLRVVNWIY
ncbi:MAG: hypothetical protein K1X83_06635 [Oligoflexia bacterium]|nr:hypothetical protein [Oligoflexia bacterium]